MLRRGTLMVTAASILVLTGSNLNYTDCYTSRTARDYFTKPWHWLGCCCISGDLPAHRPHVQLCARLCVGSVCSHLNKKNKTFTREPCSHSFQPSRDPSTGWHRRRNDIVCEDDTRHCHQPATRVSQLTARFWSNSYF